MWYLHFSCIFFICVRIFLKPIVEMTLIYRSQDAEKCILTIQLHNLFQTKGCWYFCKSGHWFRCRNKVCFKKERKSLVFIYITFSIMAITATEALCALQNDWVQKQGSDLPLHVGSAKGTWLQVPKHEHWLVPGMISTQASIIKGVMFYSSFKINCWSLGSIQKQAKAGTKWSMKDTPPVPRGTPFRQRLMYSGSGRARNLYFCFQEIDWELYSSEHPSQVLHSHVSINFFEPL